jgi:hypothetical protein
VTSRAPERPGPLRPPQLWLKFSLGTTGFRIEQMVPTRQSALPRAWAPGDPSERLTALVGNALYDKYAKKTWRLQVEHHVSGALEPEDIDLWTLEHPDHRLHVLELGWTLAELTRPPIVASFSGTILVHGDARLRPMIEEKLGLRPDDQGLDVTDWPGPREFDRGCIVVSAATDPDSIADIRAKADGAKAVLLVWTRCEPRPDKRGLIEVFVSQSSATKPTDDGWVGDLLFRLVREEALPDEALRRTVAAAYWNQLGWSVLRLRNTAKDWHSPFTRWMAEHEIPEYARRHVQELLKDAPSPRSASSPLRCSILLSLANDATAAKVIRDIPLDRPNTAFCTSAWEQEVEHPDPNAAVASQVDKLAHVLGSEDVRRMVRDMTERNHGRDLVWVDQEACRLEDVPEVKFDFGKDMPSLSTGAIELFVGSIVDALDPRHFRRVGLVVHLVLVEPPGGADGLDERLKRWAMSRCKPHVRVAVHRAARGEPPAPARGEPPAPARGEPPAPAPGERTAPAAPPGDGEVSFWQRLRRRWSAKMGRP